jgi:hypothetical protein
MTGYVIDRQGDQLSIALECGEEILEARRAFSCLIQPEPGDVVCLVQTETREAYVTDIFERPANEAANGSDASLVVPGGLEIDARRGLTFKTGGTMAIQARKLEGRVPEVDWFSRLFRVTCKELFAHVDVSRLTARVTEVLTKRAHVSAERSYRIVSEADHVRAGVIDMRGEQLVNIRAECSVLTGKKLVKVDASQVHIG